MNRPQILSVSGIARSGKDTFCKILKKQLEERGKTTTIMALAAELKDDCKDFLKQKCNVDAWTDDPEIKSSIRDLYVWYGDFQRKRTNGRYWVEKLNERIKTCTSDYIIISDVRYAYYPVDEIQWVQQEHKGILIHVSKYSWAGNRIPTKSSSETRLHKVYIEPPNEHEKKNDPIVKMNANICVDWEHLDIPSGDLLNNEYMNSVVKNALDQIEIIKG